MRFYQTYILAAYHFHRKRKEFVYGGIVTISANGSNSRKYHRILNYMYHVIFLGSGINLGNCNLIMQLKYDQLYIWLNSTREWCE